jgi:hypothetical protein
MPEFEVVKQQDCEDIKDTYPQCGGDSYLLRVQKINTLLEASSSMISLI